VRVHKRFHKFLKGLKYEKTNRNGKVKE